MQTYKVTVDDIGTRWYNEAGQLHRLDGPAVELASGTKFWYQNNKFHRLDGPAIEYADGTKFWYLEDVEYTEEEYWVKVRALTNPAKELTVAEISALLGYDVKVVK